MHLDPRVSLLSQWMPVLATLIPSSRVAVKKHLEAYPTALRKIRSSGKTDGISTAWRRPDS